MGAVSLPDILACTYAYFVCMAVNGRACGADAGVL
jgi:hypothetical protein